MKVGNLVKMKGEKYHHNRHSLGVIVGITPHTIKICWLNSNSTSTFNIYTDRLEVVCK